MKKIVTIMLAAVMAISLSACGEKTPAATVATEIIIGSLQDLSGGSSVSGIAMDRGAKIAVDEINAAGGIDGKLIKYIPYDSKGEPQEALTAYNRLVDQDKAVAVVGPPISNIGLAMTDTAAEKKVPIVGAFIDSRVTMKEDGTPQDYMFLVQPTNEQSGTIQASYLMNELKITKIALFYDKTNAFGVSQVNAFKKYVEANGGEILTEQVFKSGDVDFKTQLSKIKESGAEGIFAPNYPKDNTLYCTQMNQLGMDESIVTMGGLEFAPPFLTTLPDPSIVNNVYFALNVAFDDPKLAAINKLYIDTYEDAKTVDDISVKVYLGYDAIQLIAESLKGATEITGVAVKEGLEKITEFDALPGKISFSTKSHQPLGLSMVMYSIMGGKNEKIGPYVPVVK